MAKSGEGGGCSVGKKPEEEVGGRGGERRGREGLNERK